MLDGVPVHKKCADNPQMRGFNNILVLIKGPRNKWPEKFETSWQEHFFNLSTRTFFDEIRKEIATLFLLNSEEMSHEATVKYNALITSLEYIK
jgi:hypothetical protein